MLTAPDDSVGALTGHATVGVIVTAFDEERGKVRLANTLADEPEDKRGKARDGCLDGQFELPLESLLRRTHRLAVETNRRISGRAGATR